MDETQFDDLDMAAARAKFAARIDGRKSARKGRQRKLANASDGRSLRATGRTELVNFRAKPHIKQALIDHIPGARSACGWRRRSSPSSKSTVSTSMRSLVGIFGLLCGAVVIWTVAQYGYSSTDDPAARWNTAFLFGVIAAGGLFGHAVAVRIWPVSKLSSGLIVLACGAALMTNLSNSLAALAGRDSRRAAESASRTSAIRNDQVELGRLQKALDKLGTFNPTDQDAVDAAKRAADAATTAKERECGSGDPKQRGRYCRDKEEAERLATQALTKATADKALADRAAKIETDMAPIRDRLRSAGPVLETNVQGSAIARLFRLPDSEAKFAATLQQFVLDGVVEALIVLSLVSFELLVPQRREAPQAPSRLTTAWEALRRKRGDVRPVPSPVVRLPVADARPKLAASSTSDRPVGAIPKILTAALEPASGERVEMAEAYRSYAQGCAMEGKGPVTPEQFAEPLARFCKGAGIRTRSTRDGRVYLLDIRLVRPGEKLQADTI